MSDVVLAIAWKFSIGIAGFVIVVTFGRFFERLADILMGFIEVQMEDM